MLSLNDEAAVNAELKAASDGPINALSFSMKVKGGTAASEEPDKESKEESKENKETTNENDKE